MTDESELGYQINAIKFLKENSLTYEGVHSCYVIRKVHRKRTIYNKNIRRYFMYRLEVADTSSYYKGVIYVTRYEFDRVKEGEEIGEYSIVTSKDGMARFSKELSEHGAIRDLTFTAKQTTIQILMVIPFILIVLFMKAVS